MRSIECNRLYPFDTGAFFLGYYSAYFSKHSRCEDFKLPGDLSCASKLVNAFYTNEREYFYGRTQKNVEIPLGQFEVQGVHELCRAPAHASATSNVGLRDERSSSIEVQSKAPLDIKAACSGIILPINYLEHPPVVQALQRWGLDQKDIYTYEVNGFHGADSLIGKLYAKIQDIYEANKVL